MKSRTLTSTTAMTLFVALAVPLQLTAQHTRYKLVEIGTLGGPSSYPSIFRPGYQVINSSGVVGMTADTSTPDPNVPCVNSDCFVSHTVRWEKGVLTDLGTLPGGEGISSFASAINAHGWIAGG